MGRNMSLSFCLLAFGLVCAVVVSDQPYKSPNALDADKNKDDSQVYVYPTGFKGGRYYYGGIYRGSCHNDGLYYRDESSFVICSNGNAYVQACAPGTKSSGQHRYSPGYYYGYSDFCDINLVDQGYGPAHYAPYGVPTFGNGYGDDDGYNQKKATSYGTDQSYGQNSYRSYGDYPGGDGYSSYGSGKDVGGSSYGKGTGDSYGKKSDSSYGKSQSSYGQQGYGGRDSYEKKETAYEPNSSMKYN